MSRYARHNPSEPVRHDWLEGGVHVIDPAKLEFCPCGKVLSGDYFCCRKCWESAPAYFRIKYSKPEATELQRAQARNQILNHARRRAKHL